MDKGNAKTILQSFRSNSQDAADPHFAEALQLAAEDTELANWLSDELADDAAFIAAVNTIDIPEHLREEILYAVQPADIVDDFDDFDLAFADGLQSIAVPAGLKSQIIATAEQEDDDLFKPDNVTSIKKPTGWKHHWRSFAGIAAAISLGAYLATQIETPEKFAPLDTHAVQVQAGEFLNASFEFSLNNKQNPDNTQVENWLSEHEMPTPDTIPQGIRNLPALGCSNIKLSDGGQASLICFPIEGEGPVHLVITKRTQTRDKLPTLSQVSIKDCYNCSSTEYNVISWQDDHNTYIMLSKISPEKLASIF